MWRCNTEFIPGVFCEGATLPVSPPFHLILLCFLPLLLFFLHFHICFLCLFSTFHGGISGMWWGSWEKGEATWSSRPQQGAGRGAVAQWDACWSIKLVVSAEGRVRCCYGYWGWEWEGKGKHSLSFLGEMESVNLCYHWCFCLFTLEEELTLAQWGLWNCGEVYRPYIIRTMFWESNDTDYRYLAVQRCKKYWNVVLK